MPKIYKRNCDHCGTYYEGSRRFCSIKCANKGKGIGPGLWWYEGKPNPTIGRKRSEEEKKAESDIVKRLFADGKRVSFWKGKKGLGYKHPKASATKKRLFAEGKLVPWNKGKTAPQISLGLQKALREGWNPREHIHVKPTNPEKKLSGIIKKNRLPFEYVGDGKIIMQGHNPDFINNQSKKIVEVFGDYWHTLPGKKEKDEEKIKMYSNYGFQTLVIWERELKSLSESDIAEKIEVFLHG